MKTKVLFVVAAIMSCVSVMGQWNKSAESLVSWSEDGGKVEMGLTPNGSVWFALQCVSAETATTFLTMVDSDGNRPFDQGIVVSNYPSKAWISVGKTLYVDSDGNAIVTVSDQRKGVSGSEGYTVYKISPEGEFLWGEDGISLDGENVYSLVAGMSICQLDDGSYVFAWMHTHESDDTLYTIEMQRISDDGEMLWNAMDVRLHGDNDNYTYPYVVNGGNNQVIMLYAKGTSQDLYARKIDFDGTKVWSEDTRVYNGGWGSIPIWTLLDVHPSGDGGLIVSWNDDRNSTEIESAYMAYVKSDGEIGFTSENGQMLGYAGLRSLDVSSYYDDTSDSFYAIWRESSADQSSNRVVAQRISKEGELLWGENGLEIEKMNNNYSYSDFSIQSTDDNEIAFFYLQSSSSTEQIPIVATVHTSDTTFRAKSCISNYISNKRNLQSTPAYNDNWLVSWIEDKQLLIQGVSCELPRLTIGDKFTVDGIHYEVLNESGQVAVTYYGEDVWNVPEEYIYAGEVVIPETMSYQGATYSVTSIGDDAFLGCSGLTSVTIPESVTFVGTQAFVGCSGLTSVTIPSSVTSIGQRAFSSCHGLTEITIPESVTSIGDWAFYYCSGLTSMVVEDGNTVYDSREGCNAIIETATNTLVVGCKNTVIPNSVTSIGDDAFCDCNGLTEITIPSRVTSIGSKAFLHCHGLTAITIPNSVTEIDVNAFGACSGLTSIKVEEGNTVYDSREDCNAIIETATNTLVAGCKNTIIPNSVTSIGDYAFSFCDGLTSVTIPESVTSIGQSAFYNCTGLTSITIPNSVTSIGYDAFSYCFGLTSIRIEAVNPPAIEEITFNVVDKTIPVYVPAESLEAYQSAEYWSEFTNIIAYTELEAGDKFTVDGIHYEVLNESGQVAVTYYGEDKWNVPEEYKYAGEVVIPETVSYQGATYSVTSIGDYAFANCNGLTEITIPNSVTSIGRSAFSTCYSLTAITIPNSVTSIGYDAFYNCSGLTEITIPESVTSIGAYAFSSCSGLTSVTIPESVTSIGNYPFPNCDGLTSIKVEEGNKVFDSREGCNAIIETATNTLVAGCKKTIIPNSVTSIGNSAFWGCSGLTSVTIPNSVTSIGGSAFAHCYGLTSITIPNSVTSIGDYPFLNCDGLISIKVEDGNTVYDSREGCNAIIETATNTLVAGCKKTIIPNSVTSIGDCAFYNCHGLTEITIPESVTSIGYDAFYNCSGLTEITIPESVTSIGNEAFSDCSGLTEITIPESVTSIGDDAFSYCSGLTEITIPESVTSIGDYAFSYCYGLTSIRIEAVNPPAIEESTFNVVDKTIPVYVPAESVEAYKQAEYWSEFTNIVAYTELEAGDKFTVDGIHYEVLNESGQVAVTYYGENAWNVPEEYKYAGEVVIPETVSYQGATYSVTSIGENTFGIYSDLTEVTIPNSVTSIGDYAFADCSGLTSITIPNSVTSIGDYAFANCYGLTSVTIPNSVASIGENAFSYCSGLTSIVVEEDNRVYDSREGCNAIIETATNTLVTGCQNTVIPNSVTSIGDYAFYACDGLTEITIPGSVTSIGDHAFGDCGGLISIKVEEGNTVYDSREGCNAIIETATNTLVAGCKKTIIPNSVTSIGDNAFYHCRELTSITIPESVTSIGYRAFYNCIGLTSITIPESVTSIGNEAFLYCISLTSIRIEAVNPPAIEESTFNVVDKTIPVYVPTQECVEAYRNAGYWSEFTNIQSYTETLTYDVVVPAGTWECYIIGEFNQMSEFVPMTKINDTHYTITIEGVERSMHYQYACGNGREYVEAGDVRTYNENDVVEGWTNMPAVEAGEPEANRLQSGGVTVSRLYDVLSTARVPMVVELINEAAISALQCDIYLPEGLSVATVENGLDVAMGNRGSHDHTIDARTLDNGAIRVLVMSGTAAPLTGNAGALFTIGVIPNENYTEDAQIVICNIVMTDTDIVEYNPKQIFADCHIKESVLGDANSDGRVNVTDIVLLAKYILGGYNGNIDVLAADINQDSRINVSDIVALANLILSGKGAAGAPARQEGVQGTLSMDHVLLNTNAPTIAPMMLDNTVAYTAFQMDVIVPEGLCIEDVVCGERLTAAHNLMWKEQADGSVRIIAFATDNTPIKESQGELFHLVLSAEDGFADGEIYVSDAIFVTRGMLTHQVNDIVAGVSAPTGIEAMYSNNRVYAAHRTIVIETTCEQPAYITTIDGVSQSILLQPGRNVLQVSQQGVYIVTVGNENKKVVVK